MVGTVFSNAKNNVSGLLASAITNSTTSIPLTPGSGTNFPAAPFYCSCDFEVMWCNSVSGDTLIVQRGVDLTTAAAHNSGSLVELRNNAGLFLDLSHAVNNIENGLTIPPGLVTLNGVQTLTNKTLAKAANTFPPDTTYNNDTQELTHKTIDLSDSAKQNVIIGNVSPDPSQLVYQNILINGGFDDWGGYPNSTTLSAGTPTSGGRNSGFCNGWVVQGVNDAAITVARDTANIDPTFQSGVDCLINVSTVQGSDRVTINQNFDPVVGSVSPNDFLKVINNPFSVSARVKAISGNVQINFRFFSSGGVNTDLRGPQITVPGTWTTIKFENQVWFPNIGNTLGSLLIEFQGVGQIAIDNVMLIIGPVATTHRPSFPSITNNRLAPNVQRANLLTNGGFEIWQRGAGPFVNPNGIYTCDGWQGALDGTDALTVQRASGMGGAYCALLTFTKGNGIFTQQFRSLLYKQPEFTFLGGKTVSFSMYCLANSPNSLRISLNNYYGSADHISYSAYHPGDGTWRLLSVTSIVDPTFTFLMPAVSPSASGNFYVDSSMLVLGSVPADYVPMHPADELARCQRYYRRWSATSTIALAVGMAYATTNAGVIVPMSQKLAVAPTFTVSNVADWSLTAIGAGQISCTNVVANVMHPDAIQILAIVASGLIAGNATWMQNANGNSWIAVEANP